MNIPIKCEVWIICTRVPVLVLFKNVWPHDKERTCLRTPMSITVFSWCLRFPEITDQSRRTRITYSVLLQKFQKFVMVAPLQATIFARSLMFTLVSLRMSSTGTASVVHHLMTYDGRREDIITVAVKTGKL